MRTYGWKAVKLYEAYSLPELARMRDMVVNDPASANPAHATGRSIELYTPAARRKLDALSWAVTYHLSDIKRDAEARIAPALSTPEPQP